MSDIMCVTSRVLCRKDFPEQLESIAACRPAGIILREKDLAPSEYEALARQVMEICAEHGVRCILHSFADIARALRADAIHMPLPLLRNMTAAEKSCFRHIGASCHSVEDAIEAQKLGCTYITAGHIFETDCKKGLPGRGLPFLRAVCDAVPIPVYAIGGIDRKNIAGVRAAGAAGACLMSSLMKSDDVPGLMRDMAGE